MIMIMYMKKKFLIGGLIVIAYILITRFISIEATHSMKVQPPVICTIDNPIDAQKYDFHIINRGFPCEKIREIHNQYMVQVQPIIEKKCLMCHGFVAKMPLYAFIPPTSWLIHHDQKEAKEYMDMSFGFPFKGTGSASEDLETLRDIVRDNEMPPLQYRIMHWQSRLTEDEKTVILEWIETGLKRLEE